MNVRRGAMKGVWEVRKIYSLSIQSQVGGVLTDDSTSSGGRTREWVNPNEVCFEITRVTFITRDLVNYPKFNYI